MIRFLEYLKLEIKRAFKALPKMLLGAIVLTILVGTVAFCSLKLTSDTTSGYKVKLALVVEDDSSLMNLGLSMLDSAAVSSTSCEFLQVTKEEADKLMADGELAGILLFPEGLVRSIIDGTNKPIEVTFPENSGFESAIIRELTEAVTRILGSAQAEVYASYDFYKSHQHKEYIDTSNKLLNSAFIKLALTRESSFTQNDLSTTNDLSPINYYIAAGITLFMFLWGITCSSLVGQKNIPLASKLRVNRLGSMVQTFAKLLSMLILFLIIVSIIGFVLVFIRALGYIHSDLLTLPRVFNIILLSIPGIILCCTVILFIYELASGATTGVLLLFAFTVISFFTSGCFLPLALLPKQIQTISEYLPATLILKQLANTFKHSLNHDLTAAIVSLSVALYIFTSLIARFREEHLS